MWGPVVPADLPMGCMHARAHRAGAWPTKCLSVALSKEVKEGNQGFLLADQDKLAQETVGTWSGEPRRFWLSTAPCPLLR